MNALKTKPASQEVRISAPDSTDGAAVHDLIAACAPLDPNSLYCNLLQCSHFADTCAIARRGGEVVGFLSAYLKPGAPDTLFVWQVAVRADARGAGLARKLLEDVLRRSACTHVCRIEATITDSNDASWALFSSFAKARGAQEVRIPCFDRHIHFGGRHDSEVLISIGPFEPLHTQGQSGKSRS